MTAKEMAALDTHPATRLEAASTPPAHLHFVTLALASGATDAIGFLALGGSFTSVMTGNMVLFALALTKGDGGLVVRTAVAIVAYFVGCYAGVLISHDEPDQRLSGVERALWIEAAAFALYAFGLLISWGHHSSAVQETLLGLAAIALGIQSSAVQRHGVSGLSTTFLTGTLTSVAVALANRQPIRSSTRSVLILLGLLGGAAFGTGADLLVPRCAGFVPFVLVAGSAIQLHRHRIHRVFHSPNRS